MTQLKTYKKPVTKKMKKNTRRYYFQICRVNTSTRLYPRLRLFFFRSAAVGSLHLKYKLLVPVLARSYCGWRKDNYLYTCHVAEFALALPRCRDDAVNIVLETREHWHFDGIFIF